MPTSYLPSFYLLRWVFYALTALHTCAPFHFNHSFQDPEGGGIADRPGDMVDVFHTHFGIAGMWGSIL